MLFEVTRALRRSDDELANEIKDVISAGLLELERIGVDVDVQNIENNKNKLIVRCIVLYARSEFDYNQQGERYLNQFLKLSDALSRSGDYKEKTYE